MRKPLNWTPIQDAAIREYYSRPYQRGALKRFAEQIGRTPVQVSARALKLRVHVPAQRSHQRRWSEQELSLLEEWAHLSDKTVEKKLRARGYKRSAHSIVAQRCKIGIDRRAARAEAGVWNKQEIADALQVVPRTVDAWVRAGLKAQQDGPHEAIWISSADLRVFLAKNPDSFDVRRVNKRTFLRVLLAGVTR